MTRYSSCFNKTETKQNDTRLTNSLGGGIGEHLKSIKIRPKGMGRITCTSKRKPKIIYDFKSVARESKILTMKYVSNESNYGYAFFLYSNIKLVSARSLVFSFT